MDRLNVHGKQTVANLQMSFSGMDEVPHGEDVGDEPKDGVKLDVDFRPVDEAGDGARRTRNGFYGGPKIFGQVLATRGGRREDDDGGDGDDRVRRREPREIISRR